MKKQFYYLLALVFTVIISCEKENENLDTEKQDNSICIDCLYGKWNLDFGIIVSGNDTNMFYENSEFHEYSYGEERYVYDGYVKLNILESQYEYTEYTDEFGNTEDFISDWEWLDTYYSKTHIKIRLDFNYNNGYLKSYKVKTLNDSVFEVERIEQAYGGTEKKIQLSFIKSKVADNNGIEMVDRVKQNPTEIIGSWKLVEYEEKTNDSTYTRYYNDTVISKFYSMNGYNPIYYVKTYNKYYCRLSVAINESGEFYSEIEQGATWVSSDSIVWNGPFTDEFYGLSVFKDYWNWTDNNNPHDSIYFHPLIHFSIVDYEINFIDENEFELNSGTIYYRYLRLE